MNKYRVDIEGMFYNTSVVEALTKDEAYVKACNLLPTEYTDFDILEVKVNVTLAPGEDDAKYSK